MFKLTKASVHYGTSAYPLHGLPERFERLAKVEDLNLADLADTVGALTSFHRDFEARHIERQEIPLEGREPIIIPEHIYASANGYSLRWDKDD